MGEDIEARLAAAAEAVRQHQIAQLRQDDLRRRAADLQREIAELRDALGVEEADVRRLEGLSFSRLLASMRGDREDALARERAEADAAAYRVADAQARLAAIVREEAAAGARVAELAGANATHGALLDEKEGLLTSGNDFRGVRLLKLAEERGRLTGELKEIGEAQRAAVGAAQALAEVTERLGSAENWSTYDTFFGGGLIASAVKHSRLDDAAAAASRADRALALLRTELADVGAAHAAAPRLEISELTRFVDVFFDNIFTDWSVLNRIEEAQQNVSRCAHLVVRVRSTLDQRASTVRAALAELEKERRAILTG